MAIIKKDKNRALGALPFRIGENVDPAFESVMANAPSQKIIPPKTGPKVPLMGSVTQFNTAGTGYDPYASTYQKQAGIQAGGLNPYAARMRNAVANPVRTVNIPHGVFAENQQVSSPTAPASPPAPGIGISPANTMGHVPPPAGSRLGAPLDVPSSVARAARVGPVKTPVTEYTPPSRTGVFVGGKAWSQGQDTRPDPALIKGSFTNQWMSMTPDEQDAHPEVLEGLRSETEAGRGRQFIGSASATRNGTQTGLGMGTINNPAEVSAGGGRLIATYRPEDMPASRPQPIAAIADPWAKGNALIEREKGPQGGLGGPRFNKMPSREERLAGIQAGLTREGMSAQSKMASDAQAAQERMLGVKTKSDEVVAGLGIQSATANKAADRAQELEKARIQAGGRYETDESGNQVYVPGKVSGPAANKYNTMAPDDVRAAVVALTELEQSPIVGTGFGGRITADDKANRLAQIEAAKAGLAAVGFDPQGKTAQSAGSQPKKVNSQAEYDALPAGSPYIDSTGALKHKGRKAA